MNSTDPLLQAQQLCRDGKSQEALLVLDAARKQNPSAAIFIEMARILSEMALSQPAQTVLQQGLIQFPDDAGMVIANANYWYVHNKPEQGLEITSRYIKSAKAGHDVLLTHAHLLKANGQSDDAATIYKKIISDSPGNITALSSLGNIELDQRNYPTALEYYQAALRAEPNNAYVETQLAYTQFRCGNLKAGWKHYQARFGNASSKGIVDRRVHPFPLWNGAHLPKGKLLVWGEQAIGEEILYSSMLRDAQKLCPDGIIVECDKRLKPLFERSIQGIHFVARDVPDIALADKSIMAQCSAGQLGQFFRATFNDFPKRPAPLQADAARIQHIRAKYEQEKQKLGKTGKIVGVSWKSKPLRQGDPKSSNFSDWKIIFDQSPHLFICMQHGDISEDIQIARQHNWPFMIDDGIDQHESLDDFAAQICAVDSVISVSNTTAHMAGACGKSCTLLLPYSRGLMWHWFDKETVNAKIPMSTSPWYPSIQIVRQTHEGNWHSALSAAKHILE